jgi:hypothetical protein
LATTEYSAQPGSLQQVEAEAVVELGGRHRALELRADQEVADVGVGLEQDGRREQDVVDPDDALLVELDVVEERRAAVERKFSA